MAISGARGSMDNLTMMAASIGQAKVRGKRLERGYDDRVLPHFKRGGRGADERGFIASSFKRGLEPTEFLCSLFQAVSPLLTPPFVRQSLIHAATSHQRHGRFESLRR